LLLISTVLAIDINLCVLQSLRVHDMSTAVRGLLNRSRAFHGETIDTSITGCSIK
jgi:hypothetical protein